MIARHIIPSKNVIAQRSWLSLHRRTPHLCVALQGGVRRLFGACRGAGLHSPQRSESGMTTRENILYDDIFRRTTQGSPATNASWPFPRVGLSYSRDKLRDVQPKRVKGNVLHAFPIVIRLERCPDCVWRIEKLSVNFEAFCLGVYSGFRFDGEHGLFALDDEFYFGVAGIGRPVVGCDSVCDKFLQNELLGKRTLEIGEKRIAVKEQGGRGSRNCTEKSNVVHVELEGG